VEGAVLAENNESSSVDQEIALDIEHIKKRLEMLDQRLDNIDSIVTAIAERVMKQPITFSVTCSKCGQDIEISLIGIQKPRK
jgi:tRNA(Ser,Leu) C12 N-acetylase TAN1